VRCAVVGGGKTTTAAGQAKETLRRGTRSAVLAGFSAGLTFFWLAVLLALGGRPRLGGSATATSGGDLHAFNRKVETLSVR
jgi:hypothetical protein